MRTKPLDYTSGLSERRAIIDQTLSILSAYERNITKDDLAKKVCKFSFLNETSWTTAQSIVKRFFAKRYMDGYSYAPAEFLSNEFIERTGYKTSNSQMIFYTFTALSEEALYQFVTNYLFSEWFEKDVLTRDDIEWAISKHIESSGLICPPKRLRLISGGATGTLKEFGILRQYDDNGINILNSFTVHRPILNNLMLMELIYIFKKNGMSDHSVIHNKAWALFGLDGNDIINKLRGLSGYYIIQAAGSAVSLSRVIKDDGDFLDALGNYYSDGR